MSKKILPGAKFSSSSFFRPTAMSVAMSEAGLIPAGHLVKDFSKTGLLRHRNDNFNQRPSVQVAF